jgi:ankyrin repeat protein
VLLKKGAAPDDVKDNKETPLAMASGEGNIEIMELLLDAKADVNAKCISSGYELHVINCAIGSGKLEPVKLLVEKGAAVHSDNNCPLDWAAAQPDRKVFDYLLKVGHKDLQPYDYGMALKCAAEYGNADVFATLLEFEHEQHYLQEALDTAAGENEWDIVRLMLNKHKGLECDTLFTAVAAATEDLEELLTLVWDYASGSISQEALDKALYQATDNEKEVTVKNLLALGASANAAGSEYMYVQFPRRSSSSANMSDSYGNALTAAAYDGQLDIVQMLLDAKAHVNSKDGWALQTAAGQGHLPVVELLLQAGADVNACTDSTFFPQGTALQAAVESGKSDIVSFLLSKNADPNLGSGEYVCPIIAAACKAEGTILEQLIAADANVNVDGGTEYTSAPLINAAQSMDVKYVEMLLDKGADINHADVDGDTALICAASSGDQPCLELLLKRGADIRHVSARRGSVLQAALRAGQDTCVEFLIDYVTENIFLKEKKDTEPNVNENIVEKDSEAEVESNNSQANDTVEDKSALNTDKWVEAPKNTYDGDDWEHYDQYKQYGTTPAPLQPQPQPPPGYDHKFNQSGTTSINNDRHKHHELQGTIQTEVQTSNAPFSIPTPPFESQRYHGVGRTPSPQHLPPQNQNYGQQYDTHHNQQYQQQQQPYEIPPPQQSIYNPPPVERYSYQAYPPQDRLQSGQQQQFGAPPPLPSRESQPPPEQYPYQAYPQQNRVQSGQFGTPPPQQSIGRKPLPEQNSYQAYPPQNRMQYGQRQQQQHGANTPPSVPPGNNHSAYW